MSEQTIDWDAPLETPDGRRVRIGTIGHWKIAGVEDRGIHYVRDDGVMVYENGVEVGKMFRVRNVAPPAVPAGWFQPAGAPHAIAPGTVTITHYGEIYRWPARGLTEFWSPNGWVKQPDSWLYGERPATPAELADTTIPLADLLPDVRAEVERLRAAKAGPAVDDPSRPIEGVDIMGCDPSQFHVGTETTRGHIYVDSAWAGWFYPSGRIDTSPHPDAGRESSKAGVVLPVSALLREKLEAFRDRVRAERAAAAAKATVPIKRTVQAWVTLKDVEVLDPDGFDRHRQGWQFDEMTEAEFDRRMMACTVRLKDGAKSAPAVEPWTLENAPAPVLRVRNKEGRQVRCVVMAATVVVLLEDDGVSLRNRMTYADLLRDYEQIDGSPCGTVLRPAADAA